MAGLPAFFIPPRRRFPDLPPTAVEVGIVQDMP
jgi:hypothetical protein